MLQCAAVRAQWLGGLGKPVVALQFFFFAVGWWEMPSIHTTEQCLQLLQRIDIPYSVMYHEAAHTVDDLVRFTADSALPAAGNCKNLFLHEKKRLWLVVTLVDTKIDMKRLSKRLAGNTATRFASEQAMMENLGIRPGSVTPLAIVNDEAQQVRIFLDSRMQTCAALNVHPLENTATVSISYADLLKYIAHANHEVVILDFDEVNSMSL